MTKEKHRDDANLFTEILFILFFSLGLLGGNPSRKEMHYGNKAKIMSQI